MESFFLAETLKYLYLLFDNGGGPTNLVDTGPYKYIFNTEGHVFPAPGDVTARRHSLVAKRPNNHRHSFGAKPSTPAGLLEQESAKLARPGFNVLVDDTTSTHNDTVVVPANAHAMKSPNSPGNVCPRYAFPRGKSKRLRIPISYSVAWRLRPQCKRAPARGLHGACFKVEADPLERAVAHSMTQEGKPTREQCDRAYGDGSDGSAVIHLTEERVELMKRAILANALAEPSKREESGERERRAEDQS